MCSDMNLLKICELDMFKQDGTDSQNVTVFMGVTVCSE